jgi:hypothetical protein
MMGKILDSKTAPPLLKTFQALDGTSIKVEMLVPGIAIVQRDRNGMITIDSPSGFELYYRVEEFEEAYTFLL